MSRPARRLRRRPATLAWESLESRLALAGEPLVDLSVTIDDGRNAYVPSGTLIYTVVARNAGPDTATGAAVLVPRPAGTRAATWTATFAGGATGTASGTGGIDTLVTLPPRASATFTLTVTVAASARAPISATASVTPPASAIDVDPTNAFATDTNRLPIVVAGADIDVDGKPRVRVLDATTGTTFASFLAYESTFRGGVRVALGDVDGDGIDEVITAPGSGRMAEIRVFRLGGAELTAYRTRPFGDAYLGGIDVAAGDVTGDGLADIVAAKSRDGGDVRVFRTVTAADPVIDAPWLEVVQPFAADYAGGASVALADVGTFASGAVVNAQVPDGKMELVIGSGAGTAARVFVYDVSNRAAPRVADRINPFSGGFEGGVSVSAARVNNDGIDDIVIAAGRGGAGAVEVFDGSVTDTNDVRLRALSAFTGSTRPNGAVFAAAVDADGNGLAENYVAAQGGPAGTVGTAQAGLTKLAGGWRVAASRTFFSPQAIAAATRISTSTVPVVGTIRTFEARDLVLGAGATANAWDKLTVQYTGMLTNGTVFDSSRRADRDPFRFTLGAGQVIAGWDAGFAGMKAGGRRLLVIPAELAYGGAARPGIPANSTLVFDVELVSVTANRAATISGTSTGALTEDGTPSSVSGTLTVTDPDHSTPPLPQPQNVENGFRQPAALAGTYGAFTFNATSGAWSYALDNARPATQALTAGQVVTDVLTVTSIDGTASRAITVTVTGAGEVPTNIALSAATVAENVAVGTAVGTLSTTDADSVAPFTYALVPGTGAADNGSFTIDGAVLKTATALDFETKSSYSVRIRSTDATGLSFEKAFTVTVTNVAEAPTDIALSASSVADGAPSGTTVGTLSTTDVDAGDTFTYTLVPGTGAADNASFTIAGGLLKTAAAFDFETKSSYSVRVRTTDAGGLFVEKEFVVTVTNVNEAPTDVALSAATVAENAAIGTAVGTLSSTDVDAGDTFTYTLVSGTGATDNASFTIAGDVLKTAAVFDFETKSSYSIRVRSTDADGLFFEKAFTVTVTDANDVATISGPATGSINADGPTTTAGGTLVVADQDAGQGVFTAPAAAALAGTYGNFTFDEATGAWTYALSSSTLATVVLTSDQTVSDSLTVTSVDGTDSDTITVSITGHTMQTVTGVVNDPSPTATVPAGSTSTIRYRDFTAGTGDVATAGKIIDAYYIGLLADGSVFQALWPEGDPVPAPLTALLDVSALIPGWVYGLEGMQVGGIRVLVIPPELAYGDAGGGAGSGIPGGATLTFVVSLQGVSDPPTP